jgi:hypothetical protein
MPMYARERIESAGQDLRWPPLITPSAEPPYIVVAAATAMELDHVRRVDADMLVVASRLPTYTVPLPPSFRCLVQIF